MNSTFKNIVILIAASLSVFTISCEKEAPEYPFPLPGNDTPTPPQEEVESSHTLMFYFMGVTLKGCFVNNIKAAEKALCELSGDGGPLANKNIKPRVIYFLQETLSTAHIIEVKYNDGQSKRDTLASYEIPVIISKEDVTHYINDMMDFAPAPHYGLVVGSHGRGWTPYEAEDWRSIAGRDNHSVAPYWSMAPDALPTRFIGEGYPYNGIYEEGESYLLNIWELADAFEATNEKFKYIIYDACLMANIESLYDLRNCSEYAIASVVEIMDIGFPYHTVVPALLGDNGASFDLDGVCKAFNKYYEYNGNRSGSVSLVDCSQLEPLAEVMKSINLGKTNVVDDDDLQYYEGLSPHLYFDFGEYVNKLCPDGQKLAEFNAQLAKSVPSKYTLATFYTGFRPYTGTHKINVDIYSGLSTSQPARKFTTEYKETAWYKATH